MGRLFGRLRLESFKFGIYLVVPIAGIALLNGSIDMGWYKKWKPHYGPEAPRPVVGDVTDIRDRLMQRQPPYQQQKQQQQHQGGDER